MLNLRRLQMTVAALLALSACAPDGPDAPRPTAATATTTTVPVLDTDGAVAAAIDVRVDGCGPRIGFGSGSVIDNGDIVTAAHVVAGGESVEVIDVDGNATAADVILFDPDLDFAVLRPATPVGTPHLMRAREARADEEGLVVLPRLDLETGEVAVDVAEVRVIRPANIQTTDIYLERDVVRDGYEIEGSIDPGDSGSMVVLAGGGAGIVWARSNRNRQRAWAIDLPAEVRDLSALDGDLPVVDLGPCIRE